MSLLTDARTIAESLLKEDVNDFQIGQSVLTKQYRRRGTVKAVEGAFLQVELDKDEAQADIGSTEGGLRHFHFTALSHI